MKLICLFLTFFTTGCVSPIKNAVDLANSVETVVEPASCNNCKQGKIIRTKSFHVGVFSPKDKKGVLQISEGIAPQIELGLTNTGFSTSLRDVKLPVSIYKNDIYMRVLNSSKVDDWRFFIHVYQGGQPGSAINVLDKYRTYLLVEDSYVPMPINYTPIRNAYTICSANWGCTWDEEYIIPASLIDRSIKKRTPIKLLFRYEDIKINLSPTNINAQSISDEDGLIVDLSAEYISSFYDRARMEIYKFK